MVVVRKEGETGRGASRPRVAAATKGTGEAGKAYKLGPEYQVNIANVVGDLRTEFGLNVIKA